MTNDLNKLIAIADKAIRNEWDAKADGEAAMSVIGNLMAQAVAAGTYTGDALVIATRVYSLRANAAASSGAQISKLANFATVARQWTMAGASVIDALTKATAGINKRYETTQSVLVRLKKMGDKPRPTDAEIVAMVSEAQAPKAKPPKTSADTADKLLNDLGTFAKDEGFPPELATAYQHLATYAKKLGPTTADLKKNGDKLALAASIAKAVAGE